MPRQLALLLSLLTVGSLTAAAQQQVVGRVQQKKKPGVERVWEGYLYADRKGRTRLGWEVIAMGVMAQDEHVLGEELARKLAPYVSKVPGDYFFWNYSWFGTTKGKGLPDTAVDDVPRVLVRLRGRVVYRTRDGRPPDPNVTFFGNSGTRTMGSGRVEAMEFLSAEWLKAWQGLIRPDFDPYWHNPTRKIEDDRGKVEAIAARVVPALARMRALSRVTDELRAKARSVDPAARVVNRFQRRIENVSLRWLYRMREKHGLEPEGLGMLGKLPPTGVEIRNWFVEAADKAAFLARVRKAWDGDLTLLQLPYHERSGASVTWQTAWLDGLAAHWTEERFRSCQATTREMDKEKR